jgi:hypothetical protein
MLDASDRDAIENVRKRSGHLRWFANGPEADGIILFGTSCSPGAVPAAALRSHAGFDNGGKSCYPIKKDPR